jgi:proteic killer suppression protein
MIRTFKCSDTAKLFHNERILRWVNIEDSARTKLNFLQAAVTLSELGALKGNKLKALKGDRTGQHSIRINIQYRICFRWEGTDAHDVEINKHYE